MVKFYGHVRICLNHKTQNYYELLKVYFIDFFKIIEIVMSIYNQWCIQGGLGGHVSPFLKIKLKKKFERK